MSQVETNVEEIKSFIDYCLMFYGKGEMYATRAYATLEDVAKATEIYLTRGDEKFFIDGEHRWGGGDTIDREIVAGIMIDEMGIDLY